MRSMTLLLTTGMASAFLLGCIEGGTQSEPGRSEFNEAVPDEPIAEQLGVSMQAETMNGCEICGRFSRVLQISSCCDGSCDRPENRNMFFEQVLYYTCPSGCCIGNEPDRWGCGLGPFNHGFLVERFIRTCFGNGGYIDERVESFWDDCSHSNWSVSCNMDARCYSFCQP